MKRTLILALLAGLLPVLALAQPAADTFPEDAGLALGATVAQMRNWPLDGMPVTLMPGGNFQFLEKDFRYKGFQASYVELLKLKLLADNPLHRYMQAVIHFTDAQGRLALTQMAAEYALYENKGIMLRNVAVWPLFTPNPRFEMYAVPASRLEAVGKSIASSYVQLHDFAKRNAVVSGTGEFAIMIFSKDRIAPETSLNFILSENANAGNIDDSMAEFAAVNDNGWVVAVTQGPATLGDMNNLLYVNVFAARQDGQRVLTASFDTSMRQPPPPAPPFQHPAQQAARTPGGRQVPATALPQPVKPQPQQQPVRQDKGPLEQGRMMLNPIFPDQVKLIQLRLQTLGYYHGPIDMDFNPLTEKALDNFARQNGFPAGQWSLNLQRALFRGSGQ